MIPTRDELSRTIDEAEWQWLKAHLERGGLVVVSPELDLAETGVSIAADDIAVISRLLASSLLAKPTLEQIAAWDGERSKKFLMLIVSPYVLIQEPPSSRQ